MELTAQVAPGEWQHIFDYLIKDKKIFKKSWFLASPKFPETGEKQEYGVRYFERQYQEELVHLFESEDWEAILKLPMGEHSRCATQIVCRYIPSGKVVAVQIHEARPHEDGRTVGITPGKIFMGTEGEKIVSLISQINQEY